MNRFSRLNEEEQGKPVKLDLRDKKILSILSEDSRTPISDIAKKLSINRDTVKYKIKRMQDLDVIKQFYAEVDVGIFGYTTYHVYMLLDHLYDKKQQELVEELITHPNTKSVKEYNDQWDLEWSFIAKNLEDFDHILTEISSKFSDITLEKDKLVVVKYYYTTKLPWDFYKKAGYEAKVITEGHKKIKLDAKDFAILKILTENARENAVKIAQKVKLSADAVIKRIRKMYDSHVIKRFTVVTDRGKMGYHWYTFALRMKYFDKEHKRKFMEFVKEHPYIIRCVRTLGGWDLLMYICTSQSSNFHKTVKEIKHEFSDIIKSYQTWVAYKEHGYINFPRVIKLEDHN